MAEKASADDVGCLSSVMPLQELGKQNPELLQMINSNQEEFLRMINDPAPQGQPDMGDLAGVRLNASHCLVACPVLLLVHAVHCLSDLSFVLFL